MHTLTDGIVPSPELVSTVKRLYEIKLKVTIDSFLYFIKYSFLKFDSLTSGYQ